ncbi:MAG TPA: hypothetical protein VGB20_06805 [bacterium]
MALDSRLDPLIILLRVELRLPVAAVPATIGAGVLGQMAGGLPEKRTRRASVPTASPPV